MECLASDFAVLPLEDAVNRMSRNDLPEKAVAITLDDGYRDNFEHAFPILKSLSLPATVFLATAVIGTGKILWHDRVFSAFRNTRQTLLQKFGGGGTYSLERLDQKLFAQRKVLQFLRSLRVEQRVHWIDRLVQELGVPETSGATDLMLNWEQVKVMSQGGISFGSHTVSHPILSKISKAEAMAELQQSKTAIEDRLSKTVKSFAYPSGRIEDYNAETIRALKECSYDCAVTVRFGANEVGHDPFELRRATPWDEDVRTFHLRLNYFRLFSFR
jgi:peptidoglycan/xylan/chitin deacetylase (PgdA/CDA1 family)